MLNYISQKLIDNNKRFNLTQSQIYFIKQKVEYIMTKFNRVFDLSLPFKKYNDLKLGIDYNIDGEPIPGIYEPDNNDINYNKECSSWSSMNLTNKYTLNYKDKKILVKVAYSSTADKDMFNRNINKIMTRLYNLCVIYETKYARMYGSEMHIYETEYKFYLYNNTRRSNKNMNGEEYLKQLNGSTCKCFNTSSGLTDIWNNHVLISRNEEILGLLTHEVLHVVQLFEYTNYHEMHGKNFIPTEMFINSFATIFNAYLFSIETDTIADINKNLETELLYSLNHLIRLSHITGFTLQQMMSDLSKWYQNAYLYEYIVGRVIILFNIEYFLDNPKISQIFTDRTYLFDVENDCTDILSILNEVNDFGKPNNQILNEIFNNSIGIHSTGIENENVCGNMIMQYFALDPMEIETHNQVTELYGGNYKKKYLKYKQKYLELKNKI